MTERRLQQTMEGEKLHPEKTSGYFSQENLREGFCNLPIGKDWKDFSRVMEPFCGDQWQKRKVDKFSAMTDLIGYLSKACDLKETPQLTIYYDEFDNIDAAYNRDTNFIEINAKNLHRARAIQRSLSHEVWHAYQAQHAESPKTTLDSMRRLGIKEYTNGDIDPTAYETQFVEQEANAFAEYVLEVWEKRGPLSMKEISKLPQEISEQPKLPPEGKGNSNWIERLWGRITDFFSHRFQKKPEGNETSEQNPYEKWEELCADLPENLIIVEDAKPNAKAFDKWEKLFADPERITIRTESDREAEADYSKWEELCSDLDARETDANDVKKNSETPLFQEKDILLAKLDKAQIQREMGWSGGFVDKMIEVGTTREQYELYKNADLHEMIIKGRYCLCKKIDMNYVDEKTGMTNRELMELGRSPIDSKSGEKITLHHMGQRFDGPFVELTEKTEHGDGNHSTLHPNKEGSFRKDPAKNNEYNIQRKEHWQVRAKEE